MSDFLSANAYFSLFITISVFMAMRAVQARWKHPLLNPLLLTSLVIAAFLLIADIPVTQYQAGCAPLQYLLTPATICYAVSLNEQITALKKHLGAILTGVFCGTLASLTGIRLMAMAFGLDKVLTISLLPKSITTAIGMVVSQEAGGIAALTTAAIAITGILGNVIGPTICKLLKIQHPIAQGVAFGTASHAIGTTKAAELSALAGAVSSLSLTFAGLITVALFSFFV